MRPYICNICGQEIPQPEACITQAVKSHETSYYGVLLKTTTVCRTCLEVGHKLDFRNIMIQAWKQAALQKGGTT